MRILAIALALVACSCDRDRPAPPPRDLQPPRRIIEPPTGIVRPLPPYAIRGDGVGPYKIGDKVAALLQMLPSGPRIVRFEIPGIVRTSLIRTEEDTLLIGGETASTATFVAVVDPEIARTESGIHVGSSLAELEAALGPFVDDPDRARDPRLVIAGQLRNLRVVRDGDRIAAIVVTSDPTAPRTVPDGSCERATPPPTIGRRRFPACLTSAGEIVEVTGDEVVVRPATGEARPLTLRIPNLVFAEPLRNVNDGKDEIVAVTVVEDTQEKRWSIVAYRLDGTRFVRSLEAEVLYEMSNARTRWIGAELRDVSLFLEVASQPDGIEVGGLLTTQSAGKLRDVAVISPVRVQRKSGKSMPSEAAGSGSGAGGVRGDAGSATPDGSTPLP